MVRALEELPGVNKAVASYAEKKAMVDYDPATVTPDQMCVALVKAGYVAHPAAEGHIGPVVSDAESPKTHSLQDNIYICYCFEYTKDDVIRDFKHNNRSLITEKIAAEKKAGSCDCTNKNPKGR